MPPPRHSRLADRARRRLAPPLRRPADVRTPPPRARRARSTQIPEIAALGPRPADRRHRRAARCTRASRGCKTPIKVAMLDQGLLPGMGNIQASEALHRAKHRSAPPGPVALARRGRAPRRARSSRRSTSRSPPSPRPAPTGRRRDITYVEERETPNPFLVYGKAGQPCPRGDGTITRIVQAQRATFFCAACQR